MEKTWGIYRGYHDSYNVTGELVCSNTWCGLSHECSNDNRFTIAFPTSTVQTASLGLVFAGRSEGNEGTQGES